MSADSPQTEEGRRRPFTDMDLAYEAGLEDGRAAVRDAARTLRAEVEGLPAVQHANLFPGHWITTVDGVLAAIDRRFREPSVSASRDELPDAEEMLEDALLVSDIRLHAKRCPAALEQDDNECHCYVRNEFSRVIRTALGRHFPETPR